MKKVLTIAGSDCSGGAGIQADIKTITVHKMYAMSAITALTAQNTTGVYGILEATPEFVGHQLDCIFEDIRPNAVKIGMVSNIDIIKTIARKLSEYEAENIVVDPVMVSTSGGKLLDDDAIEALISYLFPLATVITPNILEAESLVGFPVKVKEDMRKAAEHIAEFTKGSVLVTGGHLEGTTTFDLRTRKEFWFKARVTINTTGQAALCLGHRLSCPRPNPHDSVKKAKEFITGAIKANLKNWAKGKGRNPALTCSSRCHGERAPRQSRRRANHGFAGCGRLAQDSRPANTPAYADQRTFIHQRLLPWKLGLRFQRRRRGLP